MEYLEHYENKILSLINQQLQSEFATFLGRIVAPLKSGIILPLLSIKSEFHFLIAKEL